MPMMLIPPPGDKCQECAVEHDPGQPHNKQSFFYQFKFNAQNGRVATWEDAMSHCSEEVKDLWRAALKERGIDPNS